MSGRAGAHRTVLRKTALIPWVNSENSSAVAPKSSPATSTLSISGAVRSTRPITGRGV